MDVPKPPQQPLNRLYKIHHWSSWDKSSTSNFKLGKYVIQLRADTVGPTSGKCCWANYISLISCQATTTRIVSHCFQSVQICWPFTCPQQGRNKTPFCIAFWDILSCRAPGEKIIKRPLWKFATKKKFDILLVVVRYFRHRGRLGLETCYYFFRADIFGFKVA